MRSPLQAGGHRQPDRWQRCSADRLHRDRPLHQRQRIAGRRLQQPGTDGRRNGISSSPASSNGPGWPSRTVASMMTGSDSRRHAMNVRTSALARSSQWASSISSTTGACAAAAATMFNAAGAIRNRSGAAASAIPNAAPTASRCGRDRAHLRQQRRLPNPGLAAHNDRGAPITDAVTNSASRCDSALRPSRGAAGTAATMAHHRPPFSPAHN
jgi:hypothetical protein